MKKKIGFALIVTCLTICISSAQTILQILQDPVSSTMYNPQKYTSIKGSPFLYEGWIKGTATTERGIYKNVQLKLDLYSNTIFFNGKGEMYEFPETISEFVLMPEQADKSSYQYFKRDISGAPGLNPDQYVRVLVDGNVSLFRSDVVLVTEMSEINVGMVKTFTNSVRYYLKTKNGTQLIKANKKDVLSALRDKGQEIQKVIDEKKYSVKKEPDLVKVIEYYNSLFIK